MADYRRNDLPPESVPASGDRLDSWKAIATYLKRDVRTVQRWERKEALPVHRHLHGSQSSIYAYASELDAWWSSRRMQLDQSSVEGSPPETRRRTATRGAFAVMILLIVGLLLIVAINRRQAPAADAVRFMVAAPQGTQLSRFSAPALSPDGRRLVFVATSSTGKDSLWIRQLDALTVRELPGTESAVYPFWSPDSRLVGFFAHGKLTIADVEGGPMRVVCDSPGFYGGTWNRDGVILFAPTQR